MTAVAIHNPEWRLERGHVVPLVSDLPLDHHPRVPRAAKLGRAGRHSAKLKLGDYIDRTTAEPPAAVVRPHPGLAWQMFLNDRLGDCVPVAILHWIMGAHADAGTEVPAFTDADAEAWYELIGGYKPSDPSTDQGCEESVAVAKWESGLVDVRGQNHQIAGTIGVNPHDLTECRIGIYEFDGLFSGAALPLSAQGQPGWTVIGNPGSDPSAQPGSWGGHAFVEREYDPDNFKVLTWGTEILESADFHSAYVDECHVVITQEMLDQTGRGPSGVEWGDLTSDLTKLNRQASKEAKEQATQTGDKDKKRPKSKPTQEPEPAPTGTGPHDPEEDE